jgi:sec-independent protein translocase protein TatA
MPFRLEPLDIVLIIGLALLIFGPAQLPAIGRGLGQAITEFRRGAKEMAEGFRDEVTTPQQPNSVTPPSSPPVPSGHACCPGCGQQNAHEAQFCTHCGTRLPSVQNDS